jgi:flagellar hook-associated protein 1
MGIDTLFTIATSGLTAQRLAIEVTSENITNVNTAGYSRQITQFETGQTNTANGFALGTGVRVAAVQRSYDGLLQKQIVDGNSTYQQNLARQKALQQIEPLFNELTNDGLGKTVQDFLGSWHDLALNPQGSAERQTLVARAQTMTDAFHQVNSSLQDVQKNADASLPVIADDISAKAQKIASLNMQILETEHLGVNANELRDQRDLQLQELAKKVGITYADNASGSVVVKLAGGQTLVDGGNYAQVYAKTNAAVTPLNDLFVTSVGNPPPLANAAIDTNVSATIGGSGNALGELGGVLQVRDSIVPQLQANLDEMAFNLANQVNTLHATGFGLDSSTGLNFFTPAASGPLPAAAATFAGYSSAIQINGAVTGNLDKIAAADADPAAGGTGNNNNALALAALKTTGVAFSNGSSATISSYYTSLVSDVGIRVQGATNTASQGENFLRQLGSLRESNAGVSLDEELTNLIKYQKAFEGSARLVTTATTMLDTVLGLIR